MIGLEPGVVRLVPHDESWQRLFEEERERLETAVGEFVLDIQHVGSTSIPGIPAKPIIDMGVAVRNWEEAAVCIVPIEQLGYVYRGENGIPRRHFFGKGDPRSYNLHMNEVGSRDWQNQILFRDYLRQHPETAAEYAALKMRLARQYERNRDSYLAEKAPFIEEVLRLARG
jgi:GrpB-like predicted nucleotidyltransferase (UPF0157 family)